MLRVRQRLLPARDHARVSSAIRFNVDGDPEFELEPRRSRPSVANYRQPFPARHRRQTHLEKRNENVGLPGQTGSNVYRSISAAQVLAETEASIV